MDDRQSDDTMIDAALAREIEDALAVEPSSQFVARVLANRPGRRTWRFPWTIAVAVSAAAAAIIAAVLVVPGRGARTRPPDVSAVVATPPPVNATAPPAAPVPAAEPRVASAAPMKRVAPLVPIVPVAAALRRARTAEPEVLFAKDESAALQRLTRGITRGAVDPASLSEPAAVAIAAVQPGPIVVAPLTDISPVAIEPFGSLVEGARQ